LFYSFFDPGPIIRARIIISPLRILHIIILTPIDAYGCNVKESGRVRKAQVYVVVGIDLGGGKELLGFYVRFGQESKSMWLEVLRDLIDRGLKRSPFAFWHIHSDNGSEFINSHLLNYCREEGIEFTRSREHVSNDNPHVENRNMIVVRRYVGYGRYDTEAELKILEEMYRYIELRHNYFIPRDLSRKMCPISFFTLP